MVNETIRQELKEFLNEYGIKNRYIAKKLNMSDSTVSLWLKGERELSPDRLKILYDLMQKLKKF